jgi:hypothetical protein
MATRRKPKAYRTGGAVIPDTAPPITVSSAPMEEPTEPIIPPPSPESTEAVFRALEAQRNAERLQAAAAAQATQQQRQPVPELSARRIAFIQEHPELSAPENHEAVMGYLRQAERIGIKNEAEVDNYVLRGLHFEQLQREPERQEPEAAPSYAEPPQARQEAVSAPRSEPRRSMPMTAPVSRNESPSYSGKRTSSRGEMRLTEEERKIARDSIPDRPGAPRLTNAQKEYEYAKNKARYEEMKRNGTYSEQRDR